MLFNEEDSDLTYLFFSQRGIYIRSNHLVKSRHVVTINPTWFEDDVNRHGLRIQAEWHLSIICSHEWVQCPSKMLLVHNGRSFGVTVDPSELEPGLNYASIYVLDDNTNETLVTIPVTVIVPHISDACSVDLGSHLVRVYFSPSTTDGSCKELTQSLCIFHLSLHLLKRSAFFFLQLEDLHSWIFTLLLLIQMKMPQQVHKH